MKKATLCLFLFTLMLSLIISVYAISNTYYLDELDLQLTIPTEYSVITRDTPASDPIFSDLGTTKSAIISLFESSNIYLNAVSDTYNEEVVVTMTESILSNFSLLSDTVLNTFASALVNQYPDYGINVSKYEICQHAQAKFIRLYFTDTDQTVHGLQYYTIYDSKAMNFTMRSYEGSLSSRQETAIKTIVDSIKYDKDPPVADQGEDTESFVHTDADTGVTFTVPANWKQKAFTKDREYIDIMFISTKEDGCEMIYGSTDIWAQMSASDRVGYVRSDLNNSAFTKSDITEIYGTTADKISIVTYNGVQYFKIEANYTSDTYGVDITVPTTQLVYIDNGWLYLFQFGGTSTHKLYSDFESLVKSVQYPSVSNADATDSSNFINATTNHNSDNSSIIIAVVVLLIVVVVVVIAAVVTLRQNSKPANHTPIYNTPTPEPPSKPEPVIYCTNCGRALPLDSDFCYNCGMKIIKEEN